MERAIQLFTQNLAAYVEESVDRVVAAKLPFYMGMPRDTLRAAIGRAFAALQQDVVEGTVKWYPAFFEQLASLRARQGMLIGDVLRGTNCGFQVVSEHFERVFAADLEAQLWWERRRHEINYAGMVALNEAYFKTREAVIAEQNADIQRLSAPLLPVAQGVLVLPLVGVISEDRAGMILGSLLERISRDQATVVIMDITGIPAVDAGVAAVLGKSAQAARLLGAQVILVGISPELAQTIVRMGIPLQHIPTLADLESGVLHALRLQGRGIFELRPRSTEAPG